MPSEQPTKQYALTDKDAQTAFEAIAARKVHNQCDCEHDTGYTCHRCKRLMQAGVDVLSHDQEVAWRYAELLKSKSVIDQYEQNLAYHQRCNKLLMDMEEIGCFEDCGGQVYYRTPSNCFWSAEDLRIIADELDRRNGLDKPKSSAQTPTNSAKD